VVFIQNGCADVIVQGESNRDLILNYRIPDRMKHKILNIIDELRFSFAACLSLDFM